MDGEGGVEEIKCERVKGLNKRTGHRGGRGGGDHLRKIGFRQTERGRVVKGGGTYKSIGDSPTIRTGK